MSRPPEKLESAVQEWMRFAADDLAAAHAVLSLENKASWIAAFHAQQCGEKALKAFLISRQAKHPLTHDIGVLLEHCSDHAEWPKHLEEAYVLTEFSVMTRYPGVASDVSNEEARRAIQIAERVFETVRQSLLDARFTV